MKSFNYSPGGNNTTLINNLSQKISKNSYQNIANKLLTKSIEQVGFITSGTKTKYRLEMMGGEFCINALRCLGKWIYNTDQNLSTTVECSGTESLIELNLETWISIKLQKKFTTKIIDANSALILMDGICHFVVQSESNNTKEIKSKLVDLKNKYLEETKKFPAIGIIFVNQKNKITPLIEVIETNSLIFETACGSGTIAAYIASNYENNIFIQPSGSVFIAKQTDNYFSLNGPVSDLS